MTNDNTDDAIDVAELKATLDRTYADQAERNFGVRIPIHGIDDMAYEYDPNRTHVYSDLSMETIVTGEVEYARIKFDLERGKLVDYFDIKPRGDGWIIYGDTDDKKEVVWCRKLSANDGRCNQLPQLRDDS
jgi:hypothetical protein